jgi:hypothetical protein
MAITDKDVEKLKGTFATKEDLNRFATKEDLNRFATKEDLNKLETKVFDKFAENDRRFDEIDNKIDKKFDQVLSGMDKVMGELVKAREDRVFAKAKDDEQDLKITRLEERVQNVEVKVGVG